jgi:Ion channel
MSRIRHLDIVKIVILRLKPLIGMPVFWLLTLMGNGFVALGAVVLLNLEAGHHEKPLTLLDCVSWSVGLVTTIGYGDLIPMTDGGKLLGIVMMIGGTLFLWCYMGLFVSILLAPDISLIESQIKGIKRETDLDEKKLKELTTQMDSLQLKMDSLLAIFHARKNL